MSLRMSTETSRTACMRTLRKKNLHKLLSHDHRCGMVCHFCRQHPWNLYAVARVNQEEVCGPPYPAYGCPESYESLMHSMEDSILHHATTQCSQHRCNNSFANLSFPDSGDGDKTRPDPLQTVKQERVLPWSLSRTINQEAIKDRRRPCLPMKVTFHLQSCKRQNIMNGVDVATHAGKMSVTVVF